MQIGRIFVCYFGVNVLICTSLLNYSTPPFKIHRMTMLKILIAKTWLFFMDAPHFHGCSP